MDNKNNINVFDYSTKEAREKTVAVLFNEAKNARAKIDSDWAIFENYYNNYHSKMDDFNSAFSSLKEIIEQEDVEENSIFRKRILTDAFTQIESQINPFVPTAFFSGRDSVYDSLKAKQREYIAKCTMYENDFDSKNTENERIMRKFGDSFLKVYLGYSGNIKIDVCPKGSVYPDPSAIRLEDCEYIDYVYTMHSQEVKRLYKKELIKANIEDYELENGSYLDKLDAESENLTHSVVIIEHWYKTMDRNIACSIIICGKEIKHIDNYWKITGDTNKRFPFVHFYRIKKENSFWNTSEIKVIIPILDTIDELMTTGLQNMRLLGNDTVLVEEGTLTNTNNELDMSPGAVNMVKPGKLSGIKRLQGLQNLPSVINDIQYYQSQVQKTLRNYESNNGKETQRVVTASGLAQLRADAQEQTTIKDYDRLHAFKRLYSLIDWTALEFYQDDKLVFLGVPGTYKNKDENLTENLNTEKGNILFHYNSKNMLDKKYSQNADGIISQEFYYPDVDIEISTTSVGNSKSKLYTTQVLESILQMKITQDNYRIVIKLIEELDIRNKDLLIRDILDKYKPLEELEKLNIQMQTLQLKMQLSQIQQTLPVQEQESEQQNGIDMQMALSGLTQAEKRLLNNNPDIMQIAMEQNRQN